MTTTDLPRRELGAALSALRQAQKTSRGGPAYSVLVNRRLGRMFAAVAYVLGRTPNQVTAASATCTFAGIATIALTSPSVASSVVICLLLVVGYALDAADGQLARLRGGGSLGGEWLDHVVDAVKLGSVHLAVAINWYRFGAHSDAELLVPIGFQVVASVNFFVMILNDQLVRLRRGSTQVLLTGSSSLPYRFAVLPTDYGVLCVLFAVMFWDAFPWIYGGMAAANLAFLLLALPRWYRRVATA